MFLSVRRKRKLFGSKIVAGENDLGYFVYLSVFFVLPLGLL
jgi:hypothetical protein